MGLLPLDIRDYAMPHPLEMKGREMDREKTTSSDVWMEEHPRPDLSSEPKDLSRRRYDATAENALLDRSSVNASPVDWMPLIPTL